MILAIASRNNGQELGMRLFAVALEDGFVTYCSAVFVDSRRRTDKHSSPAWRDIGRIAECDRNHLQHFVDGILIFDAPAVVEMPAVEQNFRDDGRQLLLLALGIHLNELGGA